MIENFNFKLNVNWIISFVFIFALAWVSIPLSAQLYEVIDLTPDAHSSVGLHINDKGTVYGYIWEGGVQSPFIWDEVGGLQACFAIDSKKSSRLTNGPFRLFHDGKATGRFHQGYPSISAYVDGSKLILNESKVKGLIKTIEDTNLNNKESIKDIRFSVEKVNANGSVIGNMFYHSEGCHGGHQYCGYVWTLENDLISLLPLGMSIKDINDAEQIIGYEGGLFLFGGRRRGSFLLEGEKFTFLNDYGLTSLNAACIRINPSGLILIYDDQHSGIFFGKRFTELQTILINGLEWRVDQVHDVNSHGDIVGIAINSKGERHAVLYRPLN
jgi:hypothetical protein